MSCSVMYVSYKYFNNLTIYENVLSNFSLHHDIGSKQETAAIYGTCSEKRFLFSSKKSRPRKLGNGFSLWRKSIYQQMLLIYSMN